MQNEPDAPANASDKSLEHSPVTDKVDWSAMLAQHDMMWKTLPRGWKEAPFLGNGELGTMMYQLDSQTLRWDVGCSAAHDHRPIEEDDVSEKNVTEVAWV